MPTFEEQVKKLDFRGVIITAIITALAFVVGLFWRDAIAETIDLLAPRGEGLLYSYITAIVATVFVVVMAYILMKTQDIKIKHLLERVNSHTKQKRRLIRKLH
jgi:hypothetical protein